MHEIIDPTAQRLVVGRYSSQTALLDAVVSAFSKRLQVDFRALPSAPGLPGRIH
jgi:hypothetical protein